MIQNQENIKVVKRPEVVETYEISISPTPDKEPMILYSNNNIQFQIIEQHKKVNLEKSMIKDETNVPASLSNKVNKVWINIKQMFHKKAPTTIKLTKRIKIKNRNLNDFYKKK